MHDDLLRALAELRLAPGATWTDILARYRRLVKHWHPDKFLEPADKRYAEQKIKTIIAAKEFLEEHYHSQIHLDELCFCERKSYKKKDPQPPPETSTAPPLDTEDQSSQASDAAQGTARAPSFWDYLDDLCKNLDIGSISAGEPGWFETFRRYCDEILGKHPADAFLDIWQKPVSWTKESRRRSLILMIIMIMACDKIVSFINPQSISDQLPDRPPALPRSPFANKSENNPPKSKPINFDSDSEKQREWQYFDDKWQERQRLLKPQQQQQ